MGPNCSHLSPLNRRSCICLIGAKSVGLVFIVIPGSRLVVLKSLMSAACFMTFSRVRLSPHCSSTWARVCAWLYPQSHSYRHDCLPENPWREIRRTPSCQDHPSIWD